MNHYRIYIHKNQLSKKKFKDFLNEHLKLTSFKYNGFDYTYVGEDYMISFSDIHIDLTDIDGTKEVLFMDIVEYLKTNLNAQSISVESGDGKDYYSNLVNYNPKLINKVKHVIKELKKY